MLLDAGDAVPFDESGEAAARSEKYAESRAICRRIAWETWRQNRNAAERV